MIWIVEIVLALCLFWNRGSLICFAHRMCHSIVLIQSFFTLVCHFSTLVLEVGHEQWLTRLNILIWNLLLKVKFRRWLIGNCACNAFFCQLFNFIHSSISSKRTAKRNFMNDLFTITCQNWNINIPAMFTLITNYNYSFLFLSSPDLRLEFVTAKL